MYLGKHVTKPIQTDFHYASLANFRCTKIKINQVYKHTAFCNNILPNIS